VPGNRGKEFTFAPNHLGRFSVNITSIAQRWANGEVNDGVLLASTHWDGVDYNSSETVRDRPSLTVQFVPPRQPLLLAYDMETLTPNGRMKDKSGNGNNGTILGTTDADGQFGRARDFDGIDDKIDIGGSISVTGAFTAAMWVSSDAPGDAEIFLFLNSGNDADALVIGHYQDGRILVSRESSAASSRESVGVLGTGWTHVVVTKSATGVLTVYLDGVLNDIAA